MSIPSINFVHLTVSEIQAGQTASGKQMPMEIEQLCKSTYHNQLQQSIHLCGIFVIRVTCSVFFLSTSGMAKLRFGCFEYYHAYRSGNIFNECLCVVLGQTCGSLDEIPSVTMGSCKSSILNKSTWRAQTSAKN